MRLEAIIKFLKNYKKEIEQAVQISIIEHFYFDEDTETYRRQIIIDYPIEGYKKKKRRKKGS
jgi:hypothetical protein